MQVKDGSPFHIQLYSDAVRDALRACDLSEMDVVMSTEIQFKGTIYRKGLFLFAGQNESLLVFGEIEFVLIQGNNLVFFLVALHDSSFLPQLGVYALETASRCIQCINAEHLPDFYALPAYNTCGRKVIYLKHSVA